MTRILLILTLGSQIIFLLQRIIPDLKTMERKNMASKNLLYK
jgi:hypothetical protein